MRGVRGAGGVVLHPGLLRGDRMQHPDALDAAVGHVLVEVVIPRVVRRLDRLDPFDDGGIPLAGVATDETVKILEAQPRRPQVKRPGLAAVPVRDVVVLAIPGGVVAVLF